ncbi:MAG TPA: methionine--tRNA ligase, partial [Patescibacteria group bacterium]|nr:methionine--tRNA ligase [Patescibacteria group bacterium]
MSKYFITTTIYYINDQPHIGHAYDVIAADVLARYHRQHGDEVLFSAGLDENAQKTVNAAAAKGIADIAEYADQMAAVWQKTWRQLGLSYDTFVRTTSPEHKTAVHAFLKPVIEKGDVYPGTYEGLYCDGCEAFIKEDDLVDGKCPDHQKPPRQLKEKNYFFKLSRYQQPLLDHIKAHPHFIQPVSRRNEVVAFIERGLEDFSVSRSTQKWGIPWPGDKDQVVYVWFDALINYLTAAGYPQNHQKWWPAELHMIGKDIVKFHSIYWPAMLMSAGLTLPKSVFGHGFFTIDGTKISKSLGNAIDPVDLADRYGADALRYFLLREIPFGADGDFSHARFETVYNSDLANELGNLVQRVAVMIIKYFDGDIGPVPKHSHDEKAFHQALAELHLDRALTELWQEVKGL